MPQCDRRRLHPPAGNLLWVGAETLEQSVLDDDRQCEGDENDQQHVLADDALQQKALQTEAESEGERQHDQRCHHRVEAEQTRQQKQSVAAEDDEIPVGDVDKAHHSGRQRQADGEQRVEAAEHDALKQLVDPNGGHTTHRPK
jgi:hypothetical protein